MSPRTATPKTVPVAPTRIVVLGQAVTDVIFRTDELVGWGKTLQVDEIHLLPGGKGLNQAIAAVKQGASVSMLSAVGDDQPGSQLVSFLDGLGVSVEHIAVIPHTRTPVAGVFVRSNGETSFMGWKNREAIRISDESLDRVSPAIEAADVLMATFEMPLDTVRKALKIARRAGVMTVVNPAPAPDRSELPHALELLSEVDVLVPNYEEAVALLNKMGRGYDTTDLARDLCARQVDMVCLTNADLGCIVAQDGNIFDYEGFPAFPADTTGGSDAFCAALAIGLARKEPLDDVIRAANTAGHLSVIKRGSSSSMPTGVQMDEFLHDPKQAGMGRLRAQ